jgi:hypothetical protein
MMRTLAISLALAAAFAVPLRAQADPDSIKRRNDCRLAEQILLTGIQPRTLPGLAHVLGGVAIGARVSQARGELRLGRRAPLWGAPRSRA